MCANAAVSIAATLQRTWTGTGTRTRTPITRIPYIPYSQLAPSYMHILAAGCCNCFGAHLFLLLSLILARLPQTAASTALLALGLVCMWNYFWLCSSRCSSWRRRRSKLISNLS